MPLDPALIAKLAPLEVRARKVVEGYVAGRHASPYRGYSVEFAEHRDYAPGDDLRYLDWKLHAKTDRYYLKQFEEETNFACQLLVDTSESMTYRSEKAAVSKLEYARYVAAAIGYLVVHQQDAIGLATFDTQVSHFVRPMSTPSHLTQVLHLLDQTPAAGETSLGPILHDLAERIRKRGLVILLSDLFDDVESLMLGLKHFRHRRHDVSILHVIDPAEQDFPFEDATLFRGLENQPEQLTDPKALRRAYQREFATFLKEVARGCADLRMDYVLLRTDMPLDVALRAFLTRRMQRAGRT